MNIVALVLAVLAFCLAGFGANPFGLTELDLIAFGLALVALALLLPGLPQRGKA